jgi:flagellar biosynthesis component FlhA
VLQIGELGRHPGRPQLPLLFVATACHALLVALLAIKEEEEEHEKMKQTKTSRFVNVRGAEDW